MITQLTTITNKTFLWKLTMNMELLFKTAYTLDRWKTRCESSKTRENKEFSAFSKSRNLERFKQQKGLLRFFLYCFNVCFKNFVVVSRHLQVLLFPPSFYLTLSAFFAGQQTIYSNSHYVSHSKLQSPLTIQWYVHNMSVLFLSMLFLQIPPQGIISRVR